MVRAGAGGLKGLRLKVLNAAQLCIVYMIPKTRGVSESGTAKRGGKGEREEREAVCVVFMPHKCLSFPPLSPIRRPLDQPVGPWYLAQ